jgi:hypothetical protein
MRLLFAVLFALVLGLVQAQEPDAKAVAELIKKLGSANFADRQAATVALKKQPGAAPALREALRSADPEIQKRAAEILEHFQPQPLRDLNAAGREGRLNRFIELMADWPEGKQEEDVWDSFCAVVRKLAELHEAKGGEKMKLRLARSPNHFVLVTKRISETTKGPHDRVCFLRVGEVDLVRKRNDEESTRQNFFEDSSFIVARGKVKVLPGQPLVVLAGGSVEINGADARFAVIVSGGDVRLDGTVEGCLVIARGGVTSKGYLGPGNRIICGKTFTYDSKSNQNIITENDSNPLGYIRWADEPKEKRVPKSK